MIPVQAAAPGFFFRDHMATDVLSLQIDGAVHLPMVVHLEAVTSLRKRLDEALAGRPGRRLVDETWRDIIVDGSALGRIAGNILGQEARPVRAIAFDKTVETNWSLAWHQDRTIAVRERTEVEGFGPWSRKDGSLHVAPPMEILSRMITLRLHLDDCGPDNAPLRIARGSHRLGRVAAKAAALEAARLTEHLCLARAGDVWVYSTPILHASDRARFPEHRRVLKVDYSAEDLPGGLEWLGI